MTPLFPFDDFPPPPLTEQSLRRKAAERKQRWQIILLLLAAVLWELALLSLTILLWEDIPLLAQATLFLLVCGPAGSILLAVFYTQRGGTGQWKPQQSF